MFQETIKRLVGITSPLESDKGSNKGRMKTNSYNILLSDVKIFQASWYCAIHRPSRPNIVFAIPQKSFQLKSCVVKLQTCETVVITKLL